MRDILLNLQKLFRGSMRLKYVLNKSIVISELDIKAANIPYSEMPAIIIMPGPEETLNSSRLTRLVEYRVEILAINYYEDEDIIITGNKKTIGILKYIEDIKSSLSDEPKLFGTCLGWLHDSLRIVPGFFETLKPFTIARKIFVSYKGVEMQNTG